MDNNIKTSDEVKDCPKCGSHMTLLDNGEWWCVDGTAFGKCDGPDDAKQTSGKLTLEPISKGQLILHIGKYKVRVFVTDEDGTQFQSNAKAALHNMVVVYNEDQSEKEDMSCDNTM